MKDLIFWYAMINFLVYIAVSTVLYFKAEKKMPRSISITVEQVPRWYFVYFILSSMGSIMLMNYQIDEGGFFWTNIASLLICGVAAMAPIYNDKVLKAHMIFALTGFPAIFVGIILDFGAWWPLLVAAPVALLTYFPLKKYPWVIWLIEVELIAIMLMYYK